MVSLFSDVNFMFHYFQLNILAYKYLTMGSKHLNNKANVFVQVKTKTNMQPFCLHSGHYLSSTWLPFIYKIKTINEYLH